MKDLLTDTAQDANPRAASVRLKARPMSRAYGQRRHDFRTGKQPNYVDGARTHLNRVLLSPRPLPQIRREIEALRRARGAQRALKSNAAIVTAGIITFGHEAAQVFDRLTPDAQDAACRALTQAVADRLGTQVEALVMHLDESAIHAHFELRAYGEDGTPVSKVATAQVMSELQDLTAGIMGAHCPGIERGAKKYDRLAAGADYADTVNRSVKRLHRDLPREIAAKQADLAALTEQVTQLREMLAKDQARVAKLEAMEVRNAKEEKRLATYRGRLEKRVLALRQAEAQVEEEQARNALRQKALVQVQAEQDAREAQQQAEEAALRTRATAVKEQAEQVTHDLAALEAVTQEMAEDTVGRTERGLTLRDPAPLRVASPSLRERLAQVLRQHLGMREALAQRLGAVDSLIARVTTWLDRDELTDTARAEAEALQRDHDAGPEV